MAKRLRRPLGLLLALAILASLLCACTADSGFESDGTPKLANPEFERTPPEVLMPAYTGENVQSRDDGDGRKALVDVGSLSKGYVGIQCTAPVVARLRITKSGGADEEYPLSSDGTMNTFPLTQGSGHYTFVVFLLIEEIAPGQGNYERYMVAEADAAIEDEAFAPYLVPNKLVEYTPTSRAISLSHEITKHCGSNLEVVQQVYGWIAENIAYDLNKATELAGPRTVEYVPNPDDTLRTKDGICYDYASLAAAMLRANGIPTKLVKGNVNNGEGGTVYHAWNLVWLEESGWIAIELPTSPNDWTRIDTTFAASGGADIASVIGDGSNYYQFTVH